MRKPFFVFFECFFAAFLIYKKLHFLMMKKALLLSVHDFHAPLSRFIVRICKNPRMNIEVDLQCILWPFHKQASEYIIKRSILALSHYIDDEQFFFVFLSLLTKTQFYKLIKIAINSRFCISPSPLSHLIEMHFSVFIYLCVALARMCMKNVKLLLKNPPPSLRRYQIKSFQNCFY